MIGKKKSKILKIKWEVNYEGNGVKSFLVLRWASFPKQKEHNIYNKHKIHVTVWKITKC